MKSFKNLALAALLAAGLAATAAAQRPRVASDTNTSGGNATTTTKTTTTTTAAPGVAPSTLKVKYEGGVFGYNKKMDGTLTLDDAGERLVFRDKTNKEIFTIPYDAVMQAFADVKSKRPIAADVASRVTIFALPALLIKKKFQYLTLQYRDPNSDVSGVTSFKFGDRATLNSALATLATKAGLTQQGEVYVRRRGTTTTQTGGTSTPD